MKKKQNYYKNNTPKEQQHKTKMSRTAEKDNRQFNVQTWMYYE